MTFIIIKNNVNLNTTHNKKLNLLPNEKSTTYTKEMLDAHDMFVANPSLLEASYLPSSSIPENIFYICPFCGEFSTNTKKVIETHIRDYCPDRTVIKVNKDRYATIGSYFGDTSIYFMIRTIGNPRISLSCDFISAFLPEEQPVKKGSRNILLNSEPLTSCVKRQKCTLFNVTSASRCRIIQLGDFIKCFYELYVKIILLILRLDLLSSIIKHINNYKNKHLYSNFNTVSDDITKFLNGSKIIEPLIKDKFSYLYEHLFFHIILTQACFYGFTILTETQVRSGTTGRSLTIRTKEHLKSKQINLNDLFFFCYYKPVVETEIQEEKMLFFEGSSHRLMEKMCRLPHHQSKHKVSREKFIEVCSIVKKRDPMNFSDILFVSDSYTISFIKSLFIKNGYAILR